MSVERAYVRPGATGSRPGWRGSAPRLRPVPAGGRSPRAPFVVLVLGLLGIGLIGLLVLNTSLQQGAFVLQELQAETAELRDRQTQLADEVAARGAPGALAEQAWKLGMVANETPRFLELPGDAPAVAPETAPAQSAEGTASGGR